MSADHNELYIWTNDAGDTVVGVQTAIPWPEMDAALGISQILPEIAQDVQKGVNS